MRRKGHRMTEKETLIDAILDLLRRMDNRTLRIVYRFVLGLR